MLRSAICVFIFAAVLRNAVCDLNCFLMQDLKNSEKLMSEIKSFTKFNTSLCRPVRQYLDATRNATKECKTKKIDVMEAEAFTRDICTVGWDTYNRYLDAKPCFEKHLEDAKHCGDNVTIEMPKEPSEDALKKLYEGVCKYLGDVYECFNEKLGKPCEAEGLALTKKVTDALSSYTSGVCLEVGGASTISALSWSVLLGILSVVLTWHKY